MPLVSGARIPAPASVARASVVAVNQQCIYAQLTQTIGRRLADNAATDDDGIIVIHIKRNSFTGLFRSTARFSHYSFFMPA